MKTYLITGGAGFIGSNFILRQRRLGHARIVNLDLLTYAGNPMNLKPLQSDKEYVFVHGNIGDRKLVRDMLEEYRPH
ncbi:MAG: GDP-mannose 4,6-dehydratase, partial [Deltaproteobacteria bacterium]|nr:GDP-mannose 4,6-dehydratase [Deltaproteobacteria bacterium]